MSFDDWQYGEDEEAKSAELVVVSLLNIKRKVRDDYRLIYQTGFMDDEMRLFTNGRKWWRARQLRVWTDNSGRYQWFPVIDYYKYENFKSLRVLYGQSGVITVKELRQILKGLPGSDEIKIEAELDCCYDDCSVDYITLSHGKQVEGAWLSPEQVDAVHRILEIRKEKDNS